MEAIRSITSSIVDIADSVLSFAVSNIDTILLVNAALMFLTCFILFLLSPTRKSFLDNAFTIREFVLFIWIGSAAVLSVWGPDINLDYIRNPIRFAIGMSTVLVLVAVLRKFGIIWERNKFIQEYEEREGKDNCVDNIR